MVQGEVNCAVDDSVVIHFYEITFANFLIICNEVLAIGACNLQDVAAPDLFTVWIFENLQTITRFHQINRIVIIVLLWGLQVNRKPERLGFGAREFMVYYQKRLAK